MVQAIMRIKTSEPSPNRGHWTYSRETVHLPGSFRDGFHFEGIGVSKDLSKNPCNNLSSGKINRMERELCFGQQRIRCDREATAGLYRDIITVPGSERCTCISCKNFAAQRTNVFPEEFLRFLKELGVDPPLGMGSL
jgi:hypothetical protein